MWSRLRAESAYSVSAQVRDPAAHMPPERQAADDGRDAGVGRSSHRLRAAYGDHPRELRRSRGL